MEQTQRTRNGIQQVKCACGKWYPITAIYNHTLNCAAFYKMTGADRLGLPMPKGNDYRGMI